MIGPRGTPLVLVFFNRYLTKRIKPKVLQSAGTNVKQKKAQGPMPKLSECAGTKHTFKPIINNCGTHFVIRLYIYLFFVIFRIKLIVFRINFNLKL